MTQWKSIERFDINNPIWIIKYDLYQLNGEWVDKGTPGTEKFTSCHGWYETEEEARQVLKHFPTPNTYSIEKVHQRKIKS